MDIETGVAVVFQCLRHHDGTEIRTPDADVDNIGDRLTRVAFPCAAADLFCEITNVVKYLVHQRHDVDAIDHDRCVGPVAKSDVKNGAMFG